ncbi:MAG: RpiB/LacA/LacB family sugar-phosphate isomerase [Candidatus Micrarchaeales archaeon]
MKVYIISDNAGLGVAASNQINRSGHVAILSETITDDVKTLISDLRSNVESFDMTIMLCANAKDIAISANKVGGAAAVACKDQEDAIDAVSETRANVVVLDSARLSKTALSNIIVGLLSEQKKSGSSTKEKERERETAPAQRVVDSPSEGGIGGGIFSGLKNAANKATSAMEKPAGRAKNIRPSPRGDSMIKSVKSKGLMKSLKDSLGIIDEEK